MRKSTLIIIFILALLMAFISTKAEAQTAFYSEVLVANDPFTGNLKAAPYNAVRICTYAGPSAPLPCPDLVTVWDNSGNAISTAAVQGFGQVQSDIAGRLTFGCTPGVYTLQAQSNQHNNPVINKSISCGTNSNLTGGNNFWTGLNTFNDIVLGGPEVDLRWAGALCDGSSNDAAAIESALNLVASTNGTLKIPAKVTCVHNTPITITAGHFGIVGGIGSTLKYTGAGVQFTFDGTAIGNGLGEIVIRDLQFDAPSASSCLYFKKFVRSDITNVRCLGATGTAVVCDFCVSNKFDGLKVSRNPAPFTAVPSKGLLITNAAGSASSDNTFINPIIEGIAGEGIEIVGSNQNTFYGGTSEGHTTVNGKGIKISGTSVSNAFIGTHIESNAGTYDIELADASTIRGTVFLSLTGNDLYIGNQAKETSVLAGNYNDVTIAAGATATNIIGTRIGGVYTDGGTATNLLGANAAVANKLGVTDFNGTATFNVSPLLPNNIPLTAKTSGGTTFNAFWVTNANQTLLQYISGSSFRIRDQNGNVRVTVDDSAFSITGNFVMSSILFGKAAPSISSGFGTSPSVEFNNGTGSFVINVGTGGTATSGVIAMGATATNGWACGNINNITAAAAHRTDNTVQIASTTTTVTIENQTISTGAATAWAASDRIRIGCSAY